MSRFTDELKYRSSDDLFILVTGFRFYLSDTMSGIYCDIPAGTVTNFATIPRLAQLLLGLKSDDVTIAQAAVMHDCLVGEWSTLVGVYKDGSFVKYLTWQEAATWLNVGIRVLDNKWLSTNTSRCRALTRVRLNMIRHIVVAAVRLYGLFRPMLLRR